MPSPHSFTDCVKQRLPRPVAWLAVATLVGILFALLGPFGSYLNDGLGWRVGYWVVSMWVGMLLYGAGWAVAGRIAPPGSHASWPTIILAAAVVSIPQAFVTRMAAFWIWPTLASLGLDWSIWYLQTATIGIVATLIYALAVRHAVALPKPALPHMQATIAPEQALLGDVLALQMEDHYVRVHTPRGSQMVLMPLGRAIASVQTEGLRTHRSWWVARHAVNRVEGTPRAMQLHLSNGLRVPVARSAVAHLRAAGWISA